jgi:hypothetical protein
LFTEWQKILVISLGYYRDQLDVRLGDRLLIFSQLYAHAVSSEPASAGRMMVAHFPSLN